MLTDTKVRFFNSEMFGAPPRVLSTTGGVLQLLDACLVSGFTAQTLDSGAMTRTGVVVSVARANHKLFDHSVIEVAGASDVAYNGAHRIEVVDPDHFTFELSSSLTPASPASGTITVKVAGAGWTKPFYDSGTKRAVYRPADGPRHFFRVDDGKYPVHKVAVRAYRAMTDVNTGTGEYPTETQGHPYDMNWVRPNKDYGNSWWIVADDKAFFYLADNNYTAGICCHYFGWFKDLYGTDPDGSSMITCCSTNTYLDVAGTDNDDRIEQQNKTWINDYVDSNNPNSDLRGAGVFLAKSFDGVRESLPCGWLGYAHQNNQIRGEYNVQGPVVYAAIRYSGNQGGQGYAQTSFGYTLVPPFLEEPNYQNNSAQLRGVTPFLQCLSLYAAERNAGRVFKGIDRYGAVLSLVWGYQTWPGAAYPKGLIIPLGNWEDVL